MISKNNNYTYLLEYSNGMLYHGVRSCNCNIEDDLYYGSSKYTPKNEIPNKYILSNSKSREEALKYEIKYHKKFNVKNNKKYYNRANSTSNGFSNGRLNYKHSLETKLKIGIAHKNKILSDETKSKISKNHHNVSCENNPFYGKKHTNETKLKISKNREYKYGKENHSFGIKQKIVNCPHCGKSGGNTMVRWHFDNCKFKK